MKYLFPNEIKDAIESERQHQLCKWGHDSHEIGAWLTILRNELWEAEQAWLKADCDDYALCEILQVVAAGVACLEEHGVATRAKIEALAELEARDA